MTRAIKLFEVRDRATTISAMAVRCKVADLSDVEQRLMVRAGWGRLSCALFLIELSTGRGEHDPFAWGALGHTMRPVHLALGDHWDEYVSGEVIDAEYLRGEREEPRVSEFVGAARR